MNPAQLLNPKAFAKEKAKASKTTLKNGPPQSRKPLAQATSSKSMQRQPAYDPRSLLNPHASSAQIAAIPAAEDDHNGDFGAGIMIANLNNLTDRADVPAAKRKSPALETQEIEHERKKPKATFSRAGQGGVISDHVNQQAEPDVPPPLPPAGPIDLTADDDDEVVILSETSNPTILQGSPNEEVCLGRIPSSANVFRVPAPRKNTAAPKDLWPAMLLVFRKENPSPQNSLIDLYDSAKAKFGTLEARTASAISQLLTGSSVSKFRCTMALHARPRQQDDYPGKRVSHHLGLDITLYAPREKADQIGRFLSQRQLFLSQPLVTAGKAVVNPHMPGGLLGQDARPKVAGTAATYVTRTAEEMRTEASSMFDKIANDDGLPELEANTSIIKTPLLSHQKKGLAFLVDHERSNVDVDADSSKHSLWKFQTDARGRPSWYHVITGHETNEKPQGIQGGILADVMGLGKTLSIISLIAETRDESRRFRRSGEKATDTVCNARATLIICPKSVLSNWKEQIEAHCVAGNLQCYMYHGTNRTQDSELLAKHDIVLTSYNTAAAEFGEGTRKKRALTSVNWFRIVLDEAHSIRTQTTQVSKACCALSAERRWAVTGTPVQNSLTDLGTLFKFLRIKPFDDSHTWSQHIMAKFKLADASVVEQLQLLVGSITLRRSKETIGLVDRKEERELLTWTPEEYHLYSQFAKMSRTHFQNITGGGTAIKGKAYAHVLKSISRLRVICAHGREMLTEEDMEVIKGGDASSAIVLDIGDEPGHGEGPEAFDAFIKEKQAYETFTNMQDSEVDGCVRCGEKLGKKEDDMIRLAAQELGEDDSSDGEEEKPKSDLLGHLTPCYHLICADCTAGHTVDVEKAMTADKHYHCRHCESFVRFGMFPLLRSTLQRFIDDRKAARKVKAARWDEDSYSGEHSKVKALLSALAESANETAELPDDEPPIRSVVFSGWTSYLDLIQYALQRHSIGFVRLDGTMSVKQRTKALETFKTDPSVTVLIASIKAAGQGLNLTSANKVYVMEPQFNPGVEEQAVDRVHRLGQTRPVHIVHYIMTPSVEEGILNLQRKKKKLAALSMSNKRSKAEEVAERLRDVKDLFK